MSRFELGSCGQCREWQNCWRDEQLVPSAVEVIRGAAIARGRIARYSRAQRDDIWLVRRGAFKIVRVGIDGRESVVDFRLPGDLLTDLERHEPSGNLRTVALNEAALCRLVPPREPFAAANFWRRVARLTRLALAKSLDAVHGPTAAERVCNFLTDLAARLPRNGDAASFDLPMTRADIGSRLGLTEESVCRAMRALRRSGRFKIVHRRVTPLVTD